MSDETTPNLRERIADILDDAFPEDYGILPIAAQISAVVQPELDRRDAEIRRHREVLDVVADADLKHQFQRDQLKAAVDRVRALAINAARTECGAGWDLDPANVLAALDRGDLPAVREFAAEHDPRGEVT